MRWLVPALLVLLAACGNDPVRDEAGPQVWQSMQAALVPAKRPPQIPFEVRRATLTPEFMAKIGQPVLIGEIPGRGAARMVQVAQNGDVTTWRTGAQVTLSFRNGVLISSRGLGTDLMSAEVSRTLAALKRGHGTAKRLHAYLDGEDQTIWLEFSCQISRADGRNLRESCADPSGISFENRYRRNTRGEIVQSLQWLGPDLGQVRLERIDP